MLVEFLIDNAVLAVMVAMLGGATCYLWFFAGDRDVLDCDQAVAAINTDRAVLIDVRPRPEFDKGHIPGARHLEPDSVPTRAAALAKGRPLVLVCTRGNVSAELARKLRAAGTERAQALKGGMASWFQENHPVTRK